MGETTTTIDPSELEICLKVLDQAAELDDADPDSVTVQRAVGHLFKKLKKRRRIAARDAVSEADRQVVAATATGSPDRIDDETAGIPLASNADGASAGTLIRPRPCYICKQRYTRVDAFYHQLCPDCAAMSRAKRDARADLTGRRALLTGGRAKIGMYIALRLLRDGAHTTITTRFPNDAIRRFKAMEDSGEWIHRLRVVGIDLRDPAQVVALADSVAAQGPLDILINNAAQTVRRSPGAYSALADAESGALPAGALPDVLTFGKTSDAHPAALAGSLSDVSAMAGAALSPDAVSSLALVAKSASPDRIDAGSGDRRRRTRARPRAHEQLGPDGRGGRPDRAARGAAVQLGRPVHPRVPAAPRDGGGRRPPQVRGERLRDGGPVQPRLQGSGASAHQHGEGRAEHAHPHQRQGDARATASS